jgi:hypothetical protein
MATLKELRQRAEKAGTLYNEWIDTDMRGDERPIFAAFDAFWAAYDPRNCPVPAQRTLKEFYGLCVQWREQELLPHSFGRQLAEVLAVLGQPMPSIAEWQIPSEMLKAGVPLGAIKRAWRLDDAQLEAELAHPGSVVDGHYRAGLEAALQRQAGYADAQIVFRAPDGPMFIVDDEPAEPPTRHVPPLEQMIADGANAKQISRHHPDVTTQEIMKLAKKLGVKWPPGDGTRFVPSNACETFSQEYTGEVSVATRDLYSRDELVRMYGEREANRILSDGPSESGDAAEVARLHAEGKSIKWLAQRFTLTQMQVQALIRAARATAAE